MKLHVDFIDVVYRALHDLSEAPRTAFGENRQALSGVALEMELHPLMQKVKRKRLIRSAAYRRRNEMALRILEQHTGVDYRPYRTQVLWGPVLPQDSERAAQEEVALVQAGIHSRRTAMERLGIESAEAEWERVRGEAGG
ncbi:MAG: phage portal protein [Chloroflexi bacterium]|nr:phage portal protein [Chloroflexota bacterium]